MDNQVSMIESASTDVAPAPEKKSKKWLIVAIIVAAVVVICIGVVVFLSLSKKLKEDNPTAAVDKKTDILEIYTNLEDKIAIDDIYTVVRNMNAGATVELGDGYGYISMTDESIKDYIMFYYDDESSETAKAKEAYGFSYVFPYDGDMGKSIYCSDDCEYFDGSETHEYKSKEEAIKAYLDE